MGSFLRLDAEVQMRIVDALDFATGERTRLCGPARSAS